MFYNYLIFNMVTLSLRILLKYCVSKKETKIRTIGLELSYGETCCMVRVKSYPHHALTFTPTPVMPMNKGIEPMGEGVRVKTSPTFI